MIKKLRTVLIYVVFTSGLFMIQSVLSFGAVKPDLTVIPVFLIGLRRGAGAGLASGMLIGAFEDIISGSITGPAMLSKGLIGILSSYLSIGIFVWTPLLGMISLLLLTVLDQTVLFFSLALFSSQPAPFKELLITAFLSGAINSPAGGVIRVRNE